jgi:hypothetical protein
VRQDEPLDAGVKVAKDERGLAIGHACQRGRASALGGPGEVPDALWIDARVLAVGDEEVEAGEGTELEELGGPELLEQRPDAGPPGGQLLSEAIRSRHADPDAQLDRRTRRSFSV